MKTLSIILCAIAALAVAAVFLLPTLVDWNDYKPALQASVEEATGCPMNIEGDIDLAWFPSPTISIGPFTLGHEATKPVLAATGLSADVPFGSLVSGDLIADAVRLENPVLTYGGPFQCRPFPADPPTTADGDSGSDNQPGSTFALNQVELQNARIVWAYTPDMAPFEITTLNGGVNLNPLLNRLELEGKGIIRGRDTGISATLAQSANGDYRLTGRLDWPDRQQSLRFQGRSPGLPPEQDVAGDFTVTLASNGLDLDQDALPHPLAGRDIEITSDFILSDDRLSLNKTEARWGPVHLSGATTMRFGPKPNVDTVLSIQPLDLDALLTAGSAPKGTTAPSTASTDRNGFSDSQAGTAISTLMGLGSALAFMSTPDYSLGLELSIETLRIGGAVLKDTGFHIAVDDGTLTLDHSRIRLPGGSDLSVLGFLSNTNGTPRFEGGVSFQSDNLRRFLRWVGLPADDVPADRLRSIQIAANLMMEPGQVSLPGFSARLDTSNITGDAILTDRPSLSLTLSTDILNLDAYGLDAGLPDLVGIVSAPPTTVAQSTGPESATGGLADDGSFDWDVTLSANQVTFAGRPASNVSVKLRRSPDFMAVEQMSIGNFYGIAVNGQASLQRDQIASQMTLTVPDPHTTAIQLGAPPSIRDQLRRLGNTNGQIVMAGPVTAIETDLRFTDSRHQIQLRARSSLEPGEISFQLHDGRVDLPDLKLGDVTGLASLSLAGDITWSALQANLDGAPIQGSGRAHATTAGYDLETDFTIGLAPLIRAFPHMDNYLHIDGTPFLSGHLTADAGFLRRPVESIAAEGKFSGTLGLNAAQDLSANSRVRQAAELAGFIQTNFAGRNTSLTGTFSMAEGRMIFTGVRSGDQSARAEFDGWVDLGANRLDTDLRLYGDSTFDSPEFRLQTRGDLDYPSIKTSGKWLSDSR